MTLEEKFELLTDENKRIILDLIENLAACQS